MTPEEMVARLLYRDGLMLIVDKPAGYAVHRGPKGGESLEDHFGALRFGLPRAPALAHRLDRDTSGCLVLGRHRKALATLGKLFKSGAVRKTYWTVVEGGPAEDEGRIELALGRRDEARGWWMKVDPHGQPSVTTWKVLGRYPSPEGGGSPRSGGVGNDERIAESISPPVTSLPLGATLPLQGRDLTWLALEPLTGRTHQLRVHCAAMGWPIVGDTIYGTQASLRSLRKEPPRQDSPPLHLHAREVDVPLYKNKPPIHALAPVPLHMQERLYACGWPGETFTLIDYTNPQ
jgi:tRNA pseudouridine32 synthase/23S rRNA pseudouridine746 synthase